MEKNLHQGSNNLLDRALAKMRYKPPHQYNKKPILSYFNITKTYLKK